MAKYFYLILRDNFPVLLCKTRAEAVTLLEEETDKIVVVELFDFKKN